MLTILITVAIAILEPTFRIQPTLANWRFRMIRAIKILEIAYGTGFAIHNSIVAKNTEKTSCTSYSTIGGKEEKTPIASTATALTSPSTAVAPRSALPSMFTSQLR